MITTHTIRPAFYQKCGQMHTAGNCEDSIFTRTDNTLLFYGLADGKNGSCYGTLGGSTCLEILANLFSKNGISMLANQNFPDELPCQFMKEIRQGLQTLCTTHGGTPEDYASTLLAIAIDSNTGQYIISHLGDGCALGVYADGTVRIISPPENGITRQHTWFTTSPYAIPHFRISFGSIAQIARIVLMTDGAKSLCSGGNLLWQAQKLIQHETADQILSYLEDHPSGDDTSCIILDLSHGN